MIINRYIDCLHAWVIFFRMVGWVNEDSYFVIVNSATFMNIYNKTYMYYTYLSLICVYQLDIIFIIRSIISFFDTCMCQFMSATKGSYIKLVFCHVWTNLIFPTAKSLYIIQAPTNTTAVEGQSVVLKCRASGDPAPTYTWYFYGQPLTQLQVTQLPNGDLQMDVS